MGIMVSIRGSCKIEEGLRRSVVGSPPSQAAIRVRNGGARSRKLVSFMNTRLWRSLPLAGPTRKGSTGADMMRSQSEE